MQVQTQLRSLVAQWLVHLPLVLEVTGSIPLAGEKKIVVWASFINVISKDDIK